MNIVSKLNPSKAAWKYHAIHSTLTDTQDGVLFKSQAHQISDSGYHEDSVEHAHPSCSTLIYIYMHVPGMAIAVYATTSL